MLCAYFEIGPCCLYAIVVEIKKETAGHVDTVIAEYNFCNRVAKKVTEIVHVKWALHKHVILSACNIYFGGGAQLLLLLSFAFLLS